MSFKKIERWPSTELRQAWPTVGAMIEADWDVLAVCITTWPPEWISRSSGR